MSNLLDKLNHLINEYNRLFEKHEKGILENKPKGNEDFFYYLKNSINSIDLEVTKATTEMQYEKMNDLEKRGVNKFLKKLDTIKSKFELKLKDLGNAYNNDEYEDFLDFYDYVDTKLALERYKGKEMLGDVKEPKANVDILKNNEEKVHENNKEFAGFCRIGALFAQNFISWNSSIKDSYRKGSNDDGLYFYNNTKEEKTFKTFPEFYKHIASESEYKSPKDYLKHTILFIKSKENPEKYDNKELERIDESRNLLSPKKKKLIQEYCKIKEYKITNPHFK